MRLYFVPLITFLFTLSLQAQDDLNYNVGSAYYGDGLSNPGLMLELEREKFQSSNFSFLYRADLGYFYAGDYQAAFLELQHGYRYHFSSGLYFDQTLGLGILDTWFDTDAPFLYHDFVGYTNVNPNGNLTLAPSVSVGLGYSFNSVNKSARSIWIRPKAYWNQGFSRLHHPFFVVQLGFSITLK